MLNGFSWIDECRVAGMCRPGAHHPLEQDLRDLKGAGIGSVVSLTEITLDADLLRQEGLTYLRVPIPDFHPPSLSDIRHICSFIERSLENGRPTVVHCTAGLGRTGTVLACWLVRQGRSADEAIERLRMLRPGSIETWEQEQRVHDFAEFLLGAAN